MNRSVWLLLVLAAGVVGLLAPSSPSRGGLVTVNFATIAPPGSQIREAADEFRQRVKNDEVLSKLVVLNDKTGTWDNSEIVAALQGDDLHLAVVPTELLDSPDTELGPQPIAIFHQPLIFDGYQGLRAIQDSPIGIVALGALADAGLLGLAYWNSHITQIAANDAIGSPSDFSDREVALFSTEPNAPVLAEMGANVTSPDLSEIVAGFKDATLGAAEIDLEQATSFEPGLFTHVNEINYRAYVSVMVADTSQWYELPARAQRGLIALAEEIAGNLAEQIQERESSARGKLMELGVKFDSPSEEGMKALRQVSLDTWKEKRGVMAFLSDEVANLQLTLQASDRTSAPVTPSQRGAIDIDILFATDRNDETTNDPGATAPKDRFGNKADGKEMWCGVVKARIEADRPFASDDDDYFDIEDTPYEQRSWGDDGAACETLMVDRPVSENRKKLLLYVHGFNNTFADAVRRAAYLAQDIDYDGMVGIWSWPSAGDSNYRRDLGTTNNTQQNFAKVLETVAQLDSIESVDIIGHSLGAKILLQTLYSTTGASQTQLPTLGNIVFAAPDEARSEFRNRIPQAINTASRATMYASENDGALYTSQLYHFVYGGSIENRAGWGGSSILTINNLDSIDVQTDRGIGHSYIFDSEFGVRDVKKLIIDNLGARDRCLVESPNTRSAIYWRLNRTAKPCPAAPGRTSDRSPR